MECEPIIIYKRKSKGQVLGEFNDWNDFVELERKASNDFRAKVRAKVWKVKVGEYKEMFSEYYQSLITIRNGKTISRSGVEQNLQER